MVSTHSIRVLGRELQLKSAASPEHVARVEGLVNDKLAEAASAVSGGDSQVVAIVAMMNLAEAYLTLKNEHEAERDVVRERVAQLLGRLDWQAD